MVDGTFNLFNSCMEGLLIHSNSRYTGYLSGPNFDMVENYIYI